MDELRAQKKQLYDVNRTRVRQQSWLLSAEKQFKDNYDGCQSWLRCTPEGLYCCLCRSVTVGRSTQQQFRDHPSLRVSKSAHEAIREHRKSPSHLAAVDNLATLKRNGPIAKQLHTGEANSITMEVLKRLKTAHYLAAERRPISMYESMVGDFLTSIEYKEDALLTEGSNAYKSLRLSYTSRNIGRELTLCLSSAVRREELRLLHLAPVIAVLGDEATDSANCTQLLTYYRFLVMDPTSPFYGLPKTMFARICKIPRGDAKTVLAAYVDGFDRDGVDYKKKLGVGIADGASVFAGKFGGLHALLKNLGALCLVSSPGQDTCRPHPAPPISQSILISLNVVVPIVTLHVITLHRTTPEKDKGKTPNPVDTAVRSAVPRFLNRKSCPCILETRRSPSTATATNCRSAGRSAPRHAFTFPTRCCQRSSSWRGSCETRPEQRACSTSSSSWRA